jgi:nitrite reductase (NADH) large subunit
MVKKIINAWICPVCGYIHYGSEPPDECPICGTEKELFEPSEEEPIEESTSVSTQTEHVAVVGAGIAGVSSVEALRKAAPNVEITLISGEAYLPYYRLNLTRYLAGEISADQLDLHPESWYSENQIDLLRNTELQSIHLAQNKLTLKDGKRLEFEKLILTAGSRPFVPPIPGSSRKNVTTLRTRYDADLILEECRGGCQVICIGGGLLGLETAGALSRRGVTMTVLENQAWLLPRQLNQSAAERMLKHVNGMGISVVTQARIAELVGDESVRGVLLQDGTMIPTDFVVISAGVRPNLDLARQAGLEIKSGILVDDQMRTSQPDVFAAGDIAEHRGILYGIWGPAQMQGSIAGMNAVGQAIEFKPIPRSNTLKVLGAPCFSIGSNTPESEADCIFAGDIGENYYSFMFRKQFMIGAILIGDISLSVKIKQVIEEAQDFGDLLKANPSATNIVDYLLGL